MGNIEFPNGIPFEEAFKRSQEKMAAWMGERGQKAQNEQTQLEQRLQLLRANVSIGRIDFKSPDKLAEILADRSYLEQKIFFEKAVRQKKISGAGAINLCKTLPRNRIRLAIVENLSELDFANLEEKRRALSSLREAATDQWEQEEVKSLNPEGMDEIYLRRYRLDWEKDQDFDIMTTAAIEALAKFGKDAEDYLVDVLRVNLEKGKPPDMREIVRPENYVLHEDEGGLDGFFDDRGFPVDNETKPLFDLMYYYNSLVLRRLAEMGSKKGVDFLAESVPEKDSFNVIYYQEATELLVSMLKEAKTAGEKIDYETEKYLKLFEKPIGEDLPDEEKMEILEIAKENYFNDIYKDNPEAAQRVIDELEGELFGMDGLKNQRTYTLKYQGKIIAFCRFKPIEGKPDELYAGSLNVFKDLRELSVGGYFVRATTGKEAKNYILRAITRVDNVVNESYKKCGWVIDEEHPFEKNGVKYFNMTMDRREKK